MRSVLDGLSSQLTQQSGDLAAMVSPVIDEMQKNLPDGGAIFAAGGAIFENAREIGGRSAIDEREEVALDFAPMHAQ